MTEILERLARDLSEHSRYTRYNYPRWAADFLRRYPDPTAWDRETVLAYLDQLRQEGKGPASRQYARYVVKRLYDLEGLPAVKVRTRLTSVDVYTQQRPILSPEELVACIRAVVASPWPEQVAMTALFTVYACRSCEVARMRSEYVDRRAGTIALPTAKGGAMRVHRIPAAITPLLHPEHFPGSRSDTEMWSWWRDLERRAGIPRRERQGWHSVRRGVSRLLLQVGVLDVDLAAWMGWQPRSMVERYPMLPDEQLDDVMLGKHPLIAVWAETLGRTP
jgi:integrase